MFRVALSILKNNADAEDAVSGSVLTAYTKRDALKNPQSFKPWVMKILVRECYRILRNRRKQPFYTDIPDIPVTDSYNTGELWGAVTQLENGFRTVVVLYYYEDMSVKDIAKTLSLPPGTVKSRLSRARTQLKGLLAETEG
jgi:RNA polymerase sigma-70 factor (ECF subfamily)